MERRGSLAGEEIPSIGTALVALLIVACLIATAAAGVIEWRLNNRDESRAVLSRAGYTEVQVGRYGWFRCTAWKEPFATRFTAVDATGNDVRGTVCSDWSANSRVKLD